jgi:hypothetical protein
MQLNWGVELLGANKKHHNALFIDMDTSTITPQLLWAYRFGFASHILRAEIRACAMKNMKI